MGKIIITEDTTKYPITMIGRYAGECWGADTSDPEKNYKRGLGCLKSEHGRTWEFPDIYMIIDGYSARVIREWYTHIGGSPSRLQASTRYIVYEHGFKYVVPNSIRNDEERYEIYSEAIHQIHQALVKLNDLGTPREDSAMLLPLGMTTKVACKHNFRNIADMSGQRECTRAYWEYREIMKDLHVALSEYSEQWALLADMYLKPKCEKVGFCTEAKSCGRKPKKGETNE